MGCILIHQTMPMPEHVGVNMPSDALGKKLVACPLSFCGPLLLLAASLCLGHVQHCSANMGAQHREQDKRGGGGRSSESLEHVGAAINWISMSSCWTLEPCVDGSSKGRATQLEAGYQLDIV